jgi:hypothetical protein
MTLPLGKMGGGTGDSEHPAFEPLFFQPEVRKWGRLGSSSTPETLCPWPLALFHTITDMMTVILRIDNKWRSNPPRSICVDFPCLSYLLSVNPNFTSTTSVAATVWHIGCPKYGCEGLRVLGTRQMTGWGLEIPEIGRTGIFSPRKYLLSGKPLADNSEGLEASDVGHHPA